MILGSSLADWSLVATAAFTLAAALAAWFAVTQSRAIQRASLLPDLTVTKLTHTGPLVEVTFINAGGGIAKWTHVYYVQGAEKCDTLLPDAWLKPGDGFLFTVPMKGQGAEPRLVLYCNDFLERLHAFPLRGPERVYRARRRGRRWIDRWLALRRDFPEREAIFHDLYPEDTQYKSATAVEVQSAARI